MDWPLFFERIERSYRLLAAREAGAVIVLAAGTAAFPFCIAAAAAGYGLSAVLTTAVIVLAVSGIRGIIAFRNVREWDGALFIDRAVGGGDRFPALRELVAARSGSWVTAILQAECRRCMETHGSVRIPFLRGTGRYFFLPLLGILLVLFLPFRAGGSMPAGSATAGPWLAPVSAPAFSGPGTNVLPTATPGQADTGIQAVTPVPLSSVEQEYLAGLLNDPGVRAMVEALVQNDLGRYDRTMSQAVKAAAQGDWETVRGAARMFDFLASAGTVGPGAALHDALTEAMTAGDRARTAAELERYLRMVRDKGRRQEVVLIMKGALAGFARTTGRLPDIPERPRGSDAAIDAVAAGQGVSLPAAYRVMLQRYFNQQEEDR